MLRRLLGPLLAVLFVLALPVLVAAQDGGSSTPAKEGHLHLIPRSDCSQYRMGPVGLGQDDTLHTSPQSSAQEGIVLLTITSVAHRAGFIVTLSDESSGKLVVTILPPRGGGESTSVTLRIRLGSEGLVVVNRSNVPVRATLTSSPSCS